jgi:uncharacterized protein
MHWRVDEDAVRELVPDSLDLDTHDGSAWIGVTPFRVTGLRLHGLPPAPVLSSFPEVNVRTYVTYEDKPGIWFFSLDAASAAAVTAARRAYRLPYLRAAMRIQRASGGLRYRSARVSADGSRAELEVAYEPTGEVRPPTAGTLEHWLTERYCLYALAPSGRVLRAEIHHPPWPLQPATATFAANTMAPSGIELPPGRALLHFARRQDVVIWPPRPVA